MFQFPGLPPPGPCVRPGGAGGRPPGGLSHSDVRGSVGHVPLAAAFRSLSRPSSASCAKASTVRPRHHPSREAPSGATFCRATANLRDAIFIHNGECSLQSRYAALKVRRGGEPSRPDAARLSARRRAGGGDWSARPSGGPLPRKEVIQPHVPVRLPCYDFTPLTLHTFGASPLSVGPTTSGADDSGGVTGGVYKARERIHRGVLIRDY